MKSRLIGVALIAVFLVPLITGCLVIPKEERAQYSAVLSNFKCDKLAIDLFANLTKYLKNGKASISDGFSEDQLSQLYAIFVKFNDAMDNKCPRKLLDECTQYSHVGLSAPEKRAKGLAGSDSQLQGPVESFAYEITKGWCPGYRDAPDHDFYYISITDQAKYAKTLKCFYEQL